MRGRWENLWSAEQTCVVRLVDREAVIDKLVYTAANPVQDHLVERVHHWPGVNGLTALLAGRPLRATPLALLPARRSDARCARAAARHPGRARTAAEVLSELRDRVRAVELERAAERARTGPQNLARTPS